MTHDDHYNNTIEYHKISALEREGYYDAKNGKPLKHSVWQLRVRKMVIGILNKLFTYDSNILKVIDVGCGKGDFTIEIAKCFQQLSKICGCDFVKEALSIARKDSYSFEKISFQEADLLNMPYKDNYFDLTICINMIHHIDKSDLARALSELSRITNKHIVLEVKNSKSFYYKRIHPKSFGGISVYPTSISEVSNLLRSNRFIIRKQHGIFLLNWLSPIIVLLYEKQI